MTSPPPAPPASGRGELTDRDLVRLHWPRELRPAFDALFAIDDVMASVVANASQPALAAIKLAWWREALEQLDHAPPPAEPRLQAAAAELLLRGISGADLAQLEPGWATLLDEVPSLELVEQRGAMLFALLARLLGRGDARLDRAGALFACMDVTRRGLADLRPSKRSGLPRMPKRLRPVTTLAALALRDARSAKLEPEATPGRSWALLRHRLTGR
jgi:phytoene synthase